MNRGSIWWVQFGAGTGTEIRKDRPAIIVSNNASNRLLKQVQVIPLSSRLLRPYHTEVEVDCDGKRAKALAHQVTTVSKERIQQKIGELTPKELARVENALRTQLSL